MNLNKLHEIVDDGGTCYAEVHGVTKSHTWLSDWTTTHSLRKGLCSNQPFLPSTTSLSLLPLPVKVSHFILLLAAHLYVQDRIWFRLIFSQILKFFFICLGSFLNKL